MIFHFRPAVQLDASLQDFLDFQDSKILVFQHRFSRMMISRIFHFGPAVRLDASLQDGWQPQIESLRWER